MGRGKNTFFLVMNILLPIAFGSLAYYLMAPDVWFVKQIDRFLGGGRHLAFSGDKSPCVIFIRNHILDMIWGYALVHALFFTIGNNAASLRGIFWIAFSFSAVLEILQLAPIVHGTFDLWDIFGEFWAEAGAAIIIKKHLSKEERKDGKEKEIEKKM